MTIDHFEIRTNYNFEDPYDSSVNWSCTCKIDGRIIQEGGEDKGAEIEINIEDSDHNSANILYSFFEDDDRELINIPIPLGDPISDFSICVGLGLAQVVARAAIDCYRSNRGHPKKWRAFLSCMRQKTSGISLRAIWRAFRCARKLLGPLGDLL